uniref:Replication protein A 32 kDa subunit putative n=1 Tax=Albugo laibachii Nc14 TaxID=890382 RepID=F0WL45_9STRA|nr:replication protein A 32 kDa subunit putative [Albugo laibachii Nc14]|eukprot:CCA22005.1 replication protein A 32 kDa subunit putative [Albugo laibachii Nc14]
MNYGEYDSHENKYSYGAGGFMGSSNQQSTQGFDKGDGVERSNISGSRDSQTLLPITLRQLQAQDQAMDDVFRVDGREISIVKAVGILQNVIPHSTNVNFQLDDGSGIIDGRLFVAQEDLDHADNIMSRLHDGIYVSAVGQLRTFQGKTSFSCYSVVPIEDFNAITLHFLEVMYTHCYNTRGNLQKANPSQHQTSSTGAPWAPQGPMVNTNSDFGALDSSFSPEQKIVLDVLGTCTNDEGLPVDRIYAQVQHQMSEPQLQNVLMYLTSEGHVYSTIDENHFKRTA